MSFNIHDATWQVVALLVLTWSVSAVAGWCVRVAKVYVRLLAGGMPPDASCLRVALWVAARGHGRMFGLAARALTQRRRPGRAIAIRPGHIAVALPSAIGLTIGLHAHGLTPHGVFVIVAGIMLLLAAHIDARSGLLPDALTLPLLWMGLLVSWAGWGAVALPDALAGVMLGYGVPWLLALGFRYWRGVDGMGRGDLKLLAGLGAWVGWQALAWVLLAACLAGIAFAMWRQRTCRPTGAYPFGPFLAAAGAGVFVAGTRVHLWFCG